MYKDQYYIFEFEHDEKLDFSIMQVIIQKPYHNHKRDIGAEDLWLGMVCLIFFGLWKLKDWIIIV